MRRRSSRSTARGFTLIELMVTVGIVGLVSAMAVASLQGVVRNTRESGAVYGVAKLLDRARNLAVTQNSVVEVRRSGPTGKRNTLQVFICRAHFENPNTCTTTFEAVRGARIKLGSEDTPGVSFKDGTSTVTLRFDSRGIPTISTGVYEVKHDKQNRHRKIRVFASGQVRVY